MLFSCVLESLEERCPTVRWQVRPGVRPGVRQNAINSSSVDQSVQPFISQLEAIFVPSVLGIGLLGYLKRAILDVFPNGRDRRITPTKKDHWNRTLLNIFDSFRSQLIFQLNNSS